MIVVSEEDARVLLDAARAETRARQAAELLTLRAKLALLEAAEAKNAVIESLARRYGFDADEPFTFDHRTRTLTQPVPLEAPATDGH
jgi:hypothetical protein